MEAIIKEVEVVPSEVCWGARGSRLVCGGDDGQEGEGWPQNFMTPECPGAWLEEGHGKSRQ